MTEKYKVAKKTFQRYQTCSLVLRAPPCKMGKGGRYRWCVCIIFWCVQDVTVHPFCFLVRPDLRGFLALFSGVSRLSQSVRFVFWCVQTVAVCPPCFLVCPGCGGASVLFSGMTRLSRFFHLVFWGVRNVAACPPCFEKYSGRMWLHFRLVYWCVQNVVECPSCFLI